MIEIRMFFKLLLENSTAVVKKKIQSEAFVDIPCNCEWKIDEHRIFKASKKGG